MSEGDLIIKSSDQILITGASGFIGRRVVRDLLDQGFVRLRCLVRQSSNVSGLESVINSYKNADVEVVKGNLLSHDDCDAITRDARVIYHLAAGTGDKSYANAYLNSAVTMRNLLISAGRHQCVRRLVNVSSFTVYSNYDLKRGEIMDETCDIETSAEARGEAYCFAKVRQEQVAADYCEKFNIPCVTIRPGVVYGPGKKGLHGRIGIGTFGIFLHLGGSNRIPLTYVDNCASAIVLAGIKQGADGEVFNVVDDGLPMSREFLKLYKDNVSHFNSLYVPYRVFYLFCYLWETYAKWSEGQLPLAYNRRLCSNYWKGNQYSNEKLKRILGWRPQVDFPTAMRRYFDYQKAAGGGK